MTVYPKRYGPRKRSSFAQTQLDLFDWCVAPVAPALLPEPLAIRAITRRFGVSVHLARAIAENANLGGRA